MLLMHAALYCGILLGKITTTTWLYADQQGSI